MKFKKRTLLTTIVFFLAGSCHLNAHTQALSNEFVLLAQSEQTKKRIFMELVTLQDMGMDKESAEARIMSKFNLTYEQLVRIIQEGIEKDWLSELDG